MWLHVSENDLGADSPAEQMRNWVIANNRMAEVLKRLPPERQVALIHSYGHRLRKEGVLVIDSAEKSARTHLDGNGKMGTSPLFHRYF